VILDVGDAPTGDRLNYPEPLYQLKKLLEIEKCYGALRERNRAEMDQYLLDHLARVGLPERSRAAVLCCYDLGPIGTSANRRGQQDISGW